MWNLHFLKCYQPSLRINVGLQDLTLVSIIKNAKIDIEKAYAYGWALTHLPGDVVGHLLVNLLISP